MTFQKLRNTHVLTVPGLDGSGPEHWQTLWERRLSRCERVQMGDWAYPQRSKWIRRLDQEIRSSPAAVNVHAWLACPLQSQMTTAVPLLVP